MIYHYYFEKVQKALTFYFKREILHFQPSYLYNMGNEIEIGLLL